MSCNRCHGNHEVNTDCSCQHTSPCAEAYYNCTPVCPEDNQCIVREKVISQVFKTTSAFAMPGCGQRIWVGFEGVTEAVVGAYMWAYGFGYLKIVSYNCNTKQIELENTCSDTGCGVQAAPGDPIPQGTDFIVTPPPCGESTSGGASSLYPFLAADFTAPANGNCLDITVTNVNGLAVGKNVTLNTGVYRVDAIISGTTITICNDGAGLPGGTVVTARDGSDNLIVPVILVDSNPCSNPSILSGKLLACASGVTSPMEGIIGGQVPVYDSGTGLWTPRTLGLPVLDCTTLTVCLTLDPALPPGTEYLAIVADSSIFAMGVICAIGGTVFTVTEVVDGTHIRLLPNDPVIAIQTFAATSPVAP